MVKKLVSFRESLVLASLSDLRRSGHFDEDEKEFLQVNLNSNFAGMAHFASCQSLKYLVHLHLRQFLHK